MRVGKAKRRLVRWARYHQRCRAIGGQRGFIPGHARAYQDASTAHRWAPIGIREPWSIWEKR